MREKGLVTGGYLFSSNQDYMEASQEQESINILRAKADITNPGTALKLYNKLVENRTFHTVAGFTFLKELQNTILNAGIVKAEELEDIYIQAQSASNEIDIQTMEKYKHLSEKQKARIRNMRIINFFLVFTLLAMLIIAVYTDRTMYADFENKLVDHYSSWEDELNSREQALDKREEALGQSDYAD